MFDQLKNSISTGFTNFTRSPAYLAIEERFNRLQPRGQLVVKIGCALAVVTVTFMIINSLFSSAREKVEDYNTNLNLINNLNRLKSSLASSPMISAPPTSGSLVNRIRSVIEQSNISSNQIEEVRSSPVRARNQPLDINAVDVSLKTLNLNQITDISYKIQQISSSIKINSLDISQSQDNPEYFDFSFKVNAYYPKLAKVEQEVKEEKKKPRRRRQRNNDTEEDREDEPEEE